MIIQIIGLPGSGKTTLAKALMEHIDAVHLNADEVREDLNKDLDFSIPSRIEQARRMGALARLLSHQGRIVLVDFVCPTRETRWAFGKPDCLIWVNRIKESRYGDTNSMWIEPSNADVLIEDGMTIDEEVQYVLTTLGLPDWKAPTTLLLGRYQPWHEGHRALYDEAGKRTAQVVIGVRDTHGTSEKDPLTHSQVEQFIKEDIQEAFVVRMPNITNIVYGRDVGYKIEQVKLEDNIEAISATEKRREMGL